MDINEITLDDFKALRPDLYWEIVEELKPKLQIINEDDVEKIVTPIINKAYDTAMQNLSSVKKDVHDLIIGEMKDVIQYVDDKCKLEKRKKSVRPTVKTSARIGDYIRWLPTGEIGKVVRFVDTGTRNKLVLKMKLKNYMEVFDDIQLYEVILKK